MRTGKVILSGTHFFLRTTNVMFSTHIGIDQNALCGYAFAISLLSE